MQDEQRESLPAADLPGEVGPESEGPSRRSFVRVSSGVAMAAGLAAGYGTLGVMAGQYLYPSHGPDVGWQFLAVAEELKPGESHEYVSPSGARVVVARQSAGDTPDAFIALSSVCPHLGCQVHWESQNNRFFCPCHNGVFDPQGFPLEGPPAAANQQLVRFPLKIEDGLLYIEVPLSSFVQNDAEQPPDHLV